MLWILLSALIWVFALAAEGRISAEQTAGLLFLLVLLLAVSPRLGTVVRALLALGAVCAFVARYGGDWRARASLFSSLAELALVLCGLWIMLRGLVRALR